MERTTHTIDPFQHGYTEIQAPHVNDILSLTFLNCHILPALHSGRLCGHGAWDGQGSTAEHGFVTVVIWFFFLLATIDQLECTGNWLEWWKG